MKLAKSVFLALAATLLAGCAWVPQKITIAPQLNVSASNIGNGATVIVTVLDRRPSSRIGYRGLDSQLAAITTDENLAPLIQRKIIEGLSQQGFKAVASSEQAARELKVEIRALQYATEMDFWKGTIRTKAALQAYLKTGDAVYDKLYVGERRQTAAEAPGAKANAQLVNGAVSDALQQLLTDQKLARLLAN